MKDEWFPRLVEAIKEDGRTMRAISLDAGFGPNYVQQMIRDGKMPTAPKLLDLLTALGTPSLLYVFTGIRMRPEDEAFLRAALQASPMVRARLRDLMQAMQADAALSPLSDDQSEPTKA